MKLHHVLEFLYYNDETEKKQTRFENGYEVARVPENELEFRLVVSGSKRRYEETVKRALNLGCLRDLQVWLTVQ